MRGLGRAAWVVLSGSRGLGRVAEVALPGLRDLGCTACVALLGRARCRSRYWVANDGGCGFFGFWFDEKVG